MAPRRNRHISRRKKKFKLGALVARKFEENAKLTRDALKIAIVIALTFAAFMLASTFYAAWKDSMQTSIPIGKTRP